MTDHNSNRTVVPGRLKLAEAARNYWVVTVEQGTTRDDLKRPEFWALVSKDFRPYDRIDVQCDDGTFFAEYVVRTADRTWAKVQELAFHSLGTKDVSLTEAEALEQRKRYEAKYRGPHLRYCVERKDGDKVTRIKDGCQDEAAALTWLADHLKTIGASATVA